MARNAALLVLLVPALLQPGHAADDGGFGAGVSVNFAKVEDPAGTTDTEAGVTPLSLFYFHEIVRDWRVFTELAYATYEFDASTSAPGMDVTHLGLGLGLQRKLRLTSWAHPWVGATATVHQDSFDDRFTVDADGFLAQDLGDRDETYLSLAGHVQADYTLAGAWRLGVRAQYQHGFGDGLRQGTLTALILY